MKESFGAAAPIQAGEWQVAELALTGSKGYANPYADADLTVTFTGPTGEVIVRPGFWDGGSVWNVRFAPTAAGVWRWQSACSHADDTGLHGRSGEVHCVCNAADQPVYRHGFLRVSADRRHFVHADGTPFFWLGDTHWQMPDTERLDGCNHPEHGGGACPHGGQFQHLVADRSARGFTVYQTYPSASSAHWWTAPYTQINPERFRMIFDVQMDHLAEQGFVIALGCGHFNNSTHIPEADLCRWARYLVARYGAHPVVWITCQEMNAPATMGGKEANRMAVWQAVAREIARSDGYGHPHSAHQWVLDVATAPLGHEPWHDWFALQGGHRNSKITPQARYQGYYDFSPTRPMIETEAMYERVDCGGVNTTDEARHSAWKAMLCGSAGYTYGGAGIWALKWDADDPRWKDYNHAIGSWHEGMALPGAAQMTVLKTFFTALPWTSLAPRFGDPAWSEWVDPERCALATDGNRLYLAYCYGETAAGTLKRLDPHAAYAACWVDPRTGAATVIAEAFYAADGRWAVPEKPDGDHVLRVVMRRASDWLQSPQPRSFGTLKLPSELRVTVLAPHPDDFDTIAVTLRQLHRNGNRIDLLVLTAGESGVEEGYAAAHAPLTKAEIREHEQLCGCGRFGLPRDRVRFLRLDLSASSYDAIRAALLTLSPDIVFLPHGNDTNADHRLVCAPLRRGVREGRLTAQLCLNRDPKTIAMRVDLVTAFSAEEAAWKRELLLCHDSQHQRNLRTRGRGFDERILDDNAQAATAAGAAAPFAEVFELEPSKGDEP